MKALTASQGWVTVGMYSSTTLLPTLASMGVLIVLVVAKPLLVIGKRFAQYFLERTLEVDDPKDLIVFTLTGSLCSIVVVVMTAIVKIVSTISQ